MIIAKICIQQRDHHGALAAATGAVKLSPAHWEALYMLGRGHRLQGGIASAEQCYRRSLVAAPDNPDVLTSLGLLLRERGRIQEAICCYRRALAVDPTHMQAANNLRNILAAAGVGAGAAQIRAAKQSSLAVQVDALLHAADALLAADRYEDARALLLDAVAIAPEEATLRVALGRLDCSHGRVQSGLDNIEQAIELSPNLVEANEIGRRICSAGGLYDRALHFSDRMLELEPTEEIVVTRRLLLPCIQDSRSTIKESRARYSSGLSESLRSQVPLAQPPAVVGSASFSVASHVAFYLAYHGENNRELQMQLARLHLQRMPELAMTANHCSRPRRPGRLRVGFISRYLRKHSIGMTTRGLIDRLSRQKFEVYALRITPSTEDATTRAIRASADHTLDLPAELAAARAQIAALELDVLFFQDIGMESMSYQLAFARLAPVQCVSFGHPDTTGIPTMDYFVSNDLYETDHARDHYSEQLYLLKNLPTLAYYYRPALPQHSVSRQRLGLRAAETLYLCPQALFKLHPDFDAMLGGILTGDPNGVVVFIESAFADHKLKLTERFARNLPAGATRRIRFVPRLSYDQFLGLLASADVVLDTVHFNGMNTSLEALAFGTPVVTLPGEFQRGRHTQAMYRTMGITECIAADAAQYVDIAVKLGTHREEARVVRQKILASNHVLFENRRVVEEFERFFLEATERAMRARLDGAGATRIGPQSPHFAK